MSTNKPELIICRGLPASGKSTWANEWVAEDRTNRARVNKDALRGMIHNGVYSKDTEGMIKTSRDALVRRLLERGISVVSDDTNLARRHVVDLARIAYGGQYDWRVQSFTHVPLEVCLQRDQARAGAEYVGRTDLTRFHDQYLTGKPFHLPTDEELSSSTPGTARPYVPVTGRRAILVDIDGTVAKRGTRNPFDESRVHEDQPNIPVIEVIQMDIESGSYPIFVSGRSLNCLLETSAWIVRYIVPSNFFDLHLRPAGDNRKDSVVKMEIFDKYIRDHYNVLRVYDDRNQVVEMWRSLGLTVLQVAPGDF